MTYERGYAAGQRFRKRREILRLVWGLLLRGMKDPDGYFDSIRGIAADIEKRKATRHE